MQSVLYRLHTCAQSLFQLSCLHPAQQGEMGKDSASPTAQACKHDDSNVLHQDVAIGFRTQGPLQQEPTLQPDRSRFASLDWPAMLSPSATPRRRTPWRHLSHCMR